MKKQLNLIRLLFLLLSVTAFVSCTSVKQIGKLNMISNRNVDPALNYKLISNYSGGSDREVKKSKAVNLEMAIDQTVKKVPGGEFLMNAKIYVVNKKYFAAEGDVWGISSDKSTAEFNGFKIGDKVTWKKFGKFRTGKIEAFKDNANCLVKDEDSKTVEIKYIDLTKIQQ